MKNAIKSIMTRLIDIGLEALHAFVLETVCLNRVCFWSYIDGKSLIMLLQGRMTPSPTSCRSGQGEGIGTSGSRGGAPGAPPPLTAANL